MKPLIRGVFFCPYFCPYLVRLFGSFPEGVH